MKKILFSIILVLFATLILMGNTSTVKNDVKTVEIMNWEKTGQGSYVNLKLHSEETEPYIAVFDENNMAYMENGEGTCNVLLIYDDPAERYELIGYLVGNKINGEKLTYSVLEEDETSFEIAVSSKSMKNGLLFFLTRQKNTGENIGNFFVIMNDGEGSANVLKSCVFKGTNNVNDYDLLPVYFCKAKKLNFWDYTSSEDGTFSNEVRNVAFDYTQESSGLPTEVEPSIRAIIEQLFPYKEYSIFSDLTFTFANQGILIYSDTLYIGDETEENIIEQQNRIELFTDKHCRFCTAHSINNTALAKGAPRIVLKYYSYIPLFQILDPAEANLSSKSALSPTPAPTSQQAITPALSTEDLLQTANSYYEKRDFEAAFEWYQKSAEAGNAEAMNSIGYMYDNGLGVPQDNDRALEWFQKAAEAGNADAMYSIGRRYYYVGKGLPVDVATAIKWFERAAEAGNANAMFLIGDAYYSGRVGERDYTGAMGWFQKAANAGNEDAMFRIGYMYEFGEGVPQDMEKAQEWYDKYDAAHGDITSSVASKAQLSTNEADAENLFAQGDKYRLNGDYAAAMGYYRKAADMGNSAAMRMIGSLYQSGDGVAVDYEKALEWYLKAADLGDTTAMHNIGFLYSRGWGVVQDENKAAEWYTKAGDCKIDIGSKKDSADDKASSATPVETRFAADILSVLHDDMFKDTYRVLSEGELIQSGSYGNAVKGLQQTLNAFGQNLGVDGSAGSRTISALNEVQKAFGLEETDALNADGYAALLSALLLLESPESAAKLLPEHMSMEQYQFMQACAMVIQGKNYSAKELFEKCRYGDWETRAADCILPWPSTGVVWKDSALGGGIELTIKVNQAPDSGMHIKIYKDGTQPAAQLFVGGTGSATVSLPSGIYTIKDGTGRTWFGPEESFGNTGSYEIMTFEGGSSETELEYGYGYTITINVTFSLPDSETVNSRDISYDAF